MALSAAALKALIISETNSISGAAEDPEPLDQFAEAIANAVVAHIVASAVVTVASVSGVTTGGGVSGPGVGTIT